MNITFIEPPVVRLKNETSGIECEAPMALLCLGAALKAKGHSVQIVDAFAEGYEYHQPVNSWLTRVGLNFEQVADRIRHDVDVIGISSNFFFNFPTALELGKHLKVRFPRAKMVLGGVASSALYEKAMAVPEVDFVALNEAEESLQLLLENLNRPQDVPGIVWRDDEGSVRCNPLMPFPANLDDLPFPDRDLIDLQMYHRIGRPFGHVREKRFGTTLLTSRGCPMKCSFCSAHMAHGRKFRSRSAENVLSEIEYLVEEKGIEEIRIIDETFTLDRTRAHAIFDGLIQRGYHKRLSYTFPNGLFINSLDDEMIDKMSASNCHSVALAIESGNEYVSKNLVRKPINLDHAERVIDYFLKKTNILVCGYYIIGFPGETKSQIIETINFANKVKAHNSTISSLMPYPFTEVYDQAKKMGNLLLDESDPDFFFRLMPHSGVIRTPEFTPQWLQKIRETDRFLALLRKKRKTFRQLTIELVRRNRWGAPMVAGMILYHAVKGDLSGRRAQGGRG